MPSQVDGHVGLFDRFAGWASAFVSRAWFFAACVALIVAWAPTLPVFGSVDTWQLVVNTATSCVTFLLVALLQNSQQRADQATQHKLNAIADGLTALMDATWPDPNLELTTAARLRYSTRELRAAVGLEQRESS